MNDTPVRLKSMLNKQNVKQFVKGLKDVRVSVSFMNVLDGVVQNEIRRAVRQLGSKKTLTDAELLRYTK
jgi:hypothetical protein